MFKKDGNHAFFYLVLPQPPGLTCPSINLSSPILKHRIMALLNQLDRSLSIQALPFSPPRCLPELLAITLSHRKYSSKLLCSFLNSIFRPFVYLNIVFILLILPTSILMTAVRSFHLELYSIDFIRDLFIVIVAP